MKLGTFVTGSFLLSFIIGIWGALRKIVHAPDADTWLTAGLILWALFIISAIIEVRRSKNIDTSEKWIWSIAFIFFSGFTALIYFLIGRKRITTSNS